GAALKYLIASVVGPCPPRPTLFPYTTLFRSLHCRADVVFRCQFTDLSAQDLVAALVRSLFQLAAMDGSHLDVDQGRIPHHAVGRSEEHTSELQSRENLVCRLLLDKKKQTAAE